MKIETFGKLLNSLARHMDERLCMRLGISKAKYWSMIRDGYPPELSWLPAIQEVIGAPPAVMGELTIAALRARGEDRVAAYLCELLQFAAQRGTETTPSIVRHDSIYRADLSLHRSLAEFARPDGVENIAFPASVTDEELKPQKKSRAKGK